MSGRWRRRSCWRSRSLDCQHRQRPLWACRRSSLRRSRRPPRRAAAESISRLPRLQDEAAQPNTLRDAECNSNVTISSGGNARSCRWSGVADGSGSLTRARCSAQNKKGRHWCRPSLVLPEAPATGPDLPSGGGSVSDCPLAISCRCPDSGSARTATCRGSNWSRRCGWPGRSARSRPPGHSASEPGQSRQEAR